MKNYARCIKPRGQEIWWFIPFMSCVHNPPRFWDTCINITSAKSEAVQYTSTGLDVTTLAKWAYLFIYMCKTATGSLRAGSDQEFFYVTLTAVGIASQQIGNRPQRCSSSAISTHVYIHHTRVRFQFHYLRAFLARILTRNLLRAMISRRVWLCESEYPLQYEATPTDLHLSLSPAVLLHTMPLYTVYNYFIPQYSCLSLTILSHSWLDYLIWDILLFCVGVGAYWSVLSNWRQSAKFNKS